MEADLHFLAVSLGAAIFSYTVVWSVHYTDVFYRLRLWSHQGLNFIQRAVGCPVCLTYHVTLGATAIAAVIEGWSPAVWALSWGIVCFFALWMNALGILNYPEDDSHV